MLIWQPNFVLIKSLVPCTNLSSAGDPVGVPFSPDPTLFSDRGELSLILRVMPGESPFLGRVIEEDCF